MERGFRNFKTSAMRHRLFNDKRATGVTRIESGGTMTGPTWLRDGRELGVARTRVAWTILTAEQRRNAFFCDM